MVLCQLAEPAGGAGAHTPAMPNAKPEQASKPSLPHCILAQVEWEVLQGMFRDMRLPATTYVFTEGLASWTPAKQVDSLLP